MLSSTWRLTSALPTEMPSLGPQAFLGLGPRCRSTPSMAQATQGAPSMPVPPTGPFSGSSGVGRWAGHPSLAVVQTLVLCSVLGLGAHEWCSASSKAHPSALTGDSGLCE